VKLPNIRSTSKLLMYPFGFAAGDVNGPYMPATGNTPDCDNGCSKFNLPFGFPFLNNFSPALYVSELSFATSPQCWDIAAIKSPYARLHLVKNIKLLNISYALPSSRIKLQVIIIHWQYSTVVSTKTRFIQA
jgi:hypothetical protein